MAKPKGKKLLLLYPPLTQVTSPPLGLAALKGYLKEVCPEWEVKALDLNLFFHEILLSLYFRRGGLNAQSFPEGILAEIALQQAVEAFRGGRNFDFFERPDRYTQYADLMLRFEESGLANRAAFEACVSEQAAMPPLVEALVKEALKDTPSAIGISLCYSQQLWPALALGKALLQHTALPVIFGGSFFNELDLEAITSLRGITDYIVLGEGERPLARLLPTLALQSPRPAQPLTPVVLTPDLEPRLDSLGTPDFSDFDQRRYFSPQPVLPLLSSRGCYWRRCAFCVHYKSAGLTYRRHSMEHFIRELTAHVQRGCTNFAFIDEMISAPHFRDIAKAIKTAGLAVNYYALAKPTKEFNRELLDEVVSSGCRYILWGLESASPRLLHLMDKGTNVVDLSRVLNDANSAGLFNHAYIMAGFPTESREDFLETLAFLDRHKEALHGIHRGTFRLEVGSPVFDHPEQYGIEKIILDKSTPFYKRHSFQCVSGLSAPEIRDLFAAALPFLRSFNVYSIRLGNYRDHALLIYSKHGTKLKLWPRPIPALPF